MKIVSFGEFCQLPDGTVFSYWEHDVAKGLYRRGGVIFGDGGPIDFFESSLIAEAHEGESPCVNLTESRFAYFDYDMEFVVYEKADIEAIVEGLGVQAP